MTDRPYTEEDVELVAKAYDEVPWPCEHAGTSKDPGDWWTCNACTARTILAALSSANRLIPPGSEVREERIVTDWDVQPVREAKRTVITTPWSPSVPDTKEGS